MANSIVQNQRGATRNGNRKLKAALAFGGTPVGPSKPLAEMFACPELARSPDYLFDALTDDAVAFTVWDSSDPLDNDNAEVSGEASPALSFPANTLTPVTALAMVANDDTIGMIGVRCLVIGSATAPTLSPAFPVRYTIRGTYATTSTVATRTAASSSPGTTMTHSTTGDVDVTYPSLTSPTALHASWAPIVANPAVTARLNVTPFSVATAAAKLLAFDMDTPSIQANGPDASVVTFQVSGMSTNQEFVRNTQHQADVVDTLLQWAINTSPTPDSLVLQATGITSAELRWTGLIWVGESVPVAFRTQA
jgi:hypothetical protein